jgi:hypothetical protein
MLSDRISNSFALARSSWDVLRKDKQLVLFPVVSGVGCLLVLASFALPIIALALGHKITFFDANGDLAFWVYPVTFAFYFCNYFVIVFCNAALISCALLRFGGQEPTLGDGFRAAWSRLPQIAAWALLSATVGVLLKIVENAHEKAGEVVSGLLGTAWTVITFFVVPILVVEKVGPIDAVRRSLGLLKQTWGEALLGKVGLGLFKFLLMLPGFLVALAGAALCAGKVAVLGGVLIGVGVLYLLAVSAAGAALDAIFLGALYQYAAYRTVPAGFDAAVVERAFGRKRGDA